MTGATVATMHWRALDRDGSDKCRLVGLEGGWMLVGHARFRDDDGWGALDYVIRLDPDWHARSADISGRYAGAEVAWRLTRGAQWVLNGAPQPQLDGCTDLDLGFTPATNLMPIRRLPQVGRLDTRAAWLHLPGPRLDPLDQSYTRERGGYVRYVSANLTDDLHLQVDAHGFVTHYPDLWERAEA